MIICTLSLSLSLSLLLCTSVCLDLHSSRDLFIGGTEEAGYFLHPVIRIVQNSILGGVSRKTKSFKAYPLNEHRPSLAREGRTGSFRSTITINRTFITVRTDALSRNTLAESGLWLVIFWICRPVKSNRDKLRRLWVGWLAHYGEFEVWLRRLAVIGEIHLSVELIQIPIQLSRRRELALLGLNFSASELNNNHVRENFGRIKVKALCKSKTRKDEKSVTEIWWGRSAIF